MLCSQTFKFTLIEREKGWQSAKKVGGLFLNSENCGFLRVRIIFLPFIYSLNQHTVNKTHTKKFDSS